MFDFEKLGVYKKARAFNKDVLSLMKNTTSIDVVTKNQLRRALLNIAEGTGCFSKADFFGLLFFWDVEHFSLL